MGAELVLTIANKETANKWGKQMVACLMCWAVRRAKGMQTGNNEVGSEGGEVNGGGGLGGRLRAAEDTFGEVAAEMAGW